jgi:hypothetical protein
MATGGTEWQQVALRVRGRVLHLSMKVLGACRRLRWGKRMFFVVLIREHHKRGCLLSLRGVFTPARNGRLQVPPACRGNLGGFETISRRLSLFL